MHDGQAIEVKMASRANLAGLVGEYHIGAIGGNAGVAHHDTVRREPGGSLRRREIGRASCRERVL